MKMKIGDYVRTKKGIAKIIGQNDEMRFSYPLAWITDTFLEINDDTEYVYEEDIIKSSPNIIDLIEIGDYVNDEKIVDIGCLTNGSEKGTKVIDYYIAPNSVNYFKNEDIKSIVTKQQFSSMEYKIGDE